MGASLGGIGAIFSRLLDEDGVNPSDRPDGDAAHAAAAGETLFEATMLAERRSEVAAARIRNRVIHACAEYQQLVRAEQRRGVFFCGGGAPV